MAKKYLAEAFEALKELNEDTFNITSDGAAELQSFISDNEDTDELENIIDPLASTEEELQDSYIGKVILDCVICQSKIYKDPSEVTINEEGDLANIGEECPYCQSSDGYKVIGEVAPYSETKVDVDVTTKNGDEVANIDLTTDDEKKEESLQEDLNGITIDTDTQTINVSATEKVEDGEEMIAPVSSEVEAEFNSEEPEYQDIDIDEFDENDFDSLGENYLKRVYENIQSYKTISGRVKGNLIKLEGVITFKSGKKAKTNFVFEGKTVTKTGKLKFIGENKQFAKGKKAFTLTGKMNNNKLMVESLTYNYRAKDGKTGQSKRLYGRVCK